MISTGRRVTAIGVVVFFAACGGHGKDAVSASGSAADPLASADEEIEPPSTPAVATNASTPAAAIAPVDAPANCPIACAMLGPAGRSLADDDVATLRASLAPTVASLHGCMGDTGGRYVRAPALLARFAESGELLDMGVDSDGWSQGEQMCFDGVVHGGTQPQVTMQGRATVRCAETCGSRHGHRGDDSVSSHNGLQPRTAPAPTATQAPRPARMGGGRGGWGGRSGGGGGRGGGRGGSGSQ